MVFFLSEVELARLVAVSPNEILITPFADADASLRIVCRVTADGADEQLRWLRLYLSGVAIAARRRPRGSLAAVKSAG
jgi:hypothetical protein